MLDVLNTREEAEEAANDYAIALKAIVVEYTPPGKAKKRSSSGESSSSETKNRKHRSEKPKRNQLDD
jgi:hypothetical protein